MLVWVAQRDHQLEQALVVLQVLVSQWAQVMVQQGQVQPQQGRVQPRRGLLAQAQHRRC